MFWKHFVSLSRKNFILYRRNWKGSLCEVLCPIILVGLLLLTRLLMSKKQRDSQHLFQFSHLWYDRRGTTTNDVTKEFLDQTFLPTGTDWFKYCLDRGYGPDRSIIALAPSGNTIVAGVKATLDADLAAYNLTTQLYADRNAIFDVLNSGSYEKDGNPGICFGAVLEKSDSTTNEYQLNMIFDDVTTERSDDSNMPNQELDAANKYQRKPDEDSWEQYKLGGYSYLQNIFANRILVDRTAATAYISMANIPVKSSDYNDDDFASAATDLWNFFVLFLFLAPLYRFSFNSANEKETKVREAMKIMGLTDTPYWLSWFTYYIIINTFLCICMMLLMIPVFEYTNKFLIFVYLWVYGMTNFGFGLFIGAFFNTGKTASIVSTMLFFFSSFFIVGVQDQSVSEGLKNFASLSPAVAVQLAGVNLLAFEESGIGLGFDNWNEVYENYRFSTCIWMNVLSFFIFSILGLYLENVLPSAVGVRKPWYFPFTNQFWCGSKPKENQDQELEGDSNKVAHSSEEGDLDENAKIDPTNFEDVPENLKRKEEENQFLKIQGLKRRFGDFWAVNNLNVEMYEDQIFALLGHNGAGKSTTINMLCGMISKTKGGASIYGYDIETQMDDIRKMMGYCPQHNILFPKLTVKEHLEIFGQFKGKSKKEISEELDDLIKDLNLDSKKHVMSKDLSGGYKRKLSLGIALIGGSKVVFLDEPSSGMDVTARREMWDMLKKYKNDRIIILTTHYMEEADNLGDRIGIMSHGQMLCCGRPEFLKNKFGEGYNLVVVKEKREDNQQLESFILNNVPGSSKVSEVSSEATYLLPKESSEHFSEFFQRFDNELKKLEVTSYGVSMTTLEEVFLKVERDPDEDKADLIEKIKKKRTSMAEDNKIEEEYSISKEQVEGGSAVLWLHLTAMIIKRWILSKRNLKGYVIDLFVPAALIIVGTGLATIDFFQSSGQRTLDVSLFPLDQRLMYNSVQASGPDAPADLINGLSDQSNYTFTGLTGTYASTIAGLQSFDDDVYTNSVADPLNPVRYGHYFFNSVDYTNHQYQIVTFANSTSQDAQVAFASFMYESILRKSTGVNTLTFVTVNDPMPVVQIFKDRDKGNNAFFLAFILGIALALVPTSIVGFILNENLTQTLHQQIISGMSKVSYWLSNYLFDIIKMVITVVFAIAFVYIFDSEVKWLWLFLLLLPFGMIPYTYCTTFLFSDEGGAMNFTIYHNFFLSALFPTAFTVLRIIDSTRSIGDLLVWLFRWHPLYCTINGMVVISTKDAIATVRDATPPNELAFDYGAGGDLACLIIGIFGWTLLLVLIEIGACGCLRSKGKTIKDEEEELDDDVLKEQERIENIPEDQLAVKSNHTRKVYGDKVAVKDVSFGLDFGDCFCLLGVNGAGKTTSFKMLTNFVVPTRGDCYVKGYNAKTQFQEARKQIGYCPQFDAIFGHMTVREHLEFYAKIKKIPEQYRERLIAKELKDMNLEQYENKQAGSLSGGNKRKLSVAMAMIGNPPVVFLDEPSAGMDPKARRFMWEVIAKISTRGKNSAVILTTHSMEEAEALSTTMGIMVDGQFKCFGSKQHIKNKFGTGYQVEIKFKVLSQEQLEQKIKSTELVKFLRDKYSPSYKVENIKGMEYIMMNKEACSAVLKELLGSNVAYNEFHKNGFGKEIIEELELNGYYPAHSLLNWEYVMKNNYECLKILVDEFGEATLIEQYSPRFRYRVPRGEKSVGYFFSLMEKLKEKLELDEYSASQTTLEQIFNGFARIEGTKEEERVFTSETLRNIGANEKISESRAISMDVDQPNKPGPAMKGRSADEESREVTPSREEKSYEGGKDEED